jgi:hypothetical protein
MQLNYMKEVAGIASFVLSVSPRNPNRGIHKLEEDVIIQKMSLWLPVRVSERTSTSSSMR